MSDQLDRCFRSWSRLRPQWLRTGAGYPCGVNCLPTHDSSMQSNRTIFRTPCGDGEAPFVTQSLPPESAPGRLTIDLSALADNWRKLADRAAPGRCAAVVKANAYGIGLDRAAPALWDAGARIFFVAHLGEGFEARRLLPDEAEIYILNGLEAGARPGRLRRTSPEAGDRKRGGARALVGPGERARPHPAPAPCISTPA